MIKTLLVLAGISWGLLMASIAFFIYSGAERDDTQQRNADAIAVQNRVLLRQVKANCEVVSVLLINRADRDKTIKLFDSIRRENPALFDKLVKRAEAGDKRLKQVQGDLACDLK